MPNAVCAACGKSAVRASLEVREGERLFHLDCYRLYKRQPPPTPVKGRLTGVDGSGLVEVLVLRVSRVFNPPD